MTDPQDRLSARQGSFWWERCTRQGLGVVYYSLACVPAGSESLIGIEVTITVLEVKSHPHVAAARLRKARNDLRAVQHSLREDTGND